MKKKRFSFQKQRSVTFLPVPIWRFIPSSETSGYWFSFQRLLTTDIAANCFFGHCACMRICRVRSSEENIYVSKEAHQFMKEMAEELRSQLDPKFPSFVKTMLPSHVSGRFWLGLPTAFCRDHFPEEDTAMELADEDLGTFKSIYLPRNTGLSSGWRGFATAKGLLHGDAVVFHLVDSATFKVHILRANDFAAAGAAAQLQNQCESQAGLENREEEPGVKFKRAKRRFPMEGKTSRQACHVRDIQPEQLRDTLGADFAESQPIRRQQLPKSENFRASADPATCVNRNTGAVSAARRKDVKQEANNTENTDQRDPKRMVRIGQSDYVVSVQHEGASGPPSPQPPPLEQSSLSPPSREARSPQRTNH